MYLHDPADREFGIREWLLVKSWSEQLNNFKNKILKLFYYHEESKAYDKYSSGS